MPFIVKTPKPPYYAVIFTSINADVDHTEHTEMYQRMVKIAQNYQGYLGIEPARNPDGSGVAAVYWRDHESILAFARDPEHLIAKKKGREIWYSHYLIRICKVERDYGRQEDKPTRKPESDIGCERGSAGPRNFLTLPRLFLPQPGDNHGTEIFQEGIGRRRARDEEAQGRDIEERPIRQEGQEPQTGDRDRSFRGPGRRRESPEEGDERNARAAKKRKAKK